MNMGLTPLPTVIEDNGMNVFRQFFSKTYYTQGMVYFAEGEVTYCGDMVKWLERLCVFTSSQKRADKLMFEFFNYKYPQYKPYIQLF